MLPRSLDNLPRPIALYWGPARLTGVPKFRKNFMSLTVYIFNMFLQACSQCCMYATCFADRTRYTCHWLQTRFQEHGIRKNTGNPKEIHKKLHKETNTKQNKANTIAANQTTLTLNAQVSRTVNHEIWSEIAFVGDIKFFAKWGSRLLRVYIDVYPVYVQNH